ncbi:hypothetical protein C2845_PM14G10830 [Panicum miliaceum]|uniref:DC1 domain-containing protein n=1 Tax=Panicum miliaceum TaxID=4540 RepID=A0A3L6PNB7_PANMI|nr:hypothetical protein C2845_PM14G10830 [Panicum miliaceum]
MPPRCRRPRCYSDGGSRALPPSPILSLPLSSWWRLLPAVLVASPAAGSSEALAGSGPGAVRTCNCEEKNPGKLVIMKMCNGCNEPGHGLRYTDNGGGGGESFDLHTCCALTEDTLVHPLFPNLTFKFLKEPPPPVEDTRCDACGEYAHGFVYHCFEEDLDPHPCCATLKESTPGRPRLRPPPEDVTVVRPMRRPPPQVLGVPLQAR